jgi:hypothetical protein
MDLRGSVALRLDDQITFLNGAAGGELFAEVVHETGSAGAFVPKHLGAVGVEDISLDVGLAISEALFDWIAASWQAQDVVKDGAVLLIDHALAVKAERRFVNARLAATTFHAMDAASREPGHVSLLLRPESLTVAAGVGKVAAPMLRQRLWRAWAFRLEIDGLDTSRVSRIGSFTVPGAIGGRVDFPDLAITLAQPSAATWAAWFQDFVVHGRNADAYERRGRIHFLPANLGTPLATIELAGLGIFRLEVESGALPDQVAQVTAGLYCERMTLQHGGGNP